MSLTQLTQAALMGVTHALEPSQSRNLLAVAVAPGRSMVWDTLAFASGVAITQTLVLGALLGLGHWLGWMGQVAVLAGVLDTIALALMAGMLVWSLWHLVAPLTRKGQDDECCDAGHKRVAWSPLMMGLVAGLVPCPITLTSWLTVLRAQSLSSWSLGAMVLGFVAGLLVMMTLLALGVGLIRRLCVGCLPRHWDPRRSLAVVQCVAVGGLLLWLVVWRAGAA